MAFLGAFVIFLGGKAVCEAPVGPARVLRKVTPPVRRDARGGSGRNEADEFDVAAVGEENECVGSQSIGVGSSRCEGEILGDEVGDPGEVRGRVGWEE